MKIHFLDFITAVLVLVLLACFTEVKAQQEKIRFKEYGIKEGLPEEYASNILQDEQGFIWAATQNGLARYDGYTMQVFRPDADKPNSIGITTAGIFGMFRARDGKLWMGGRGALVSFDPRSGKFHNYKSDSKDSTKLPYDWTYVYHEDLNKNIWFANVDQGYATNHKGVLGRLHVPSGKIQFYPMLSVVRRLNDIVLNFLMAESPQDSSVWIKENHGPNKGNISRYDPHTHRFELILKDGDKIPGTNANDTILDLSPAGKSGLIPMVTTDADKLFLWDPIKRTAVHSFEIPFRGQSTAFTAFEDLYGDFWLTKNGQLFRITLKPEKIMPFPMNEGLLDFEGLPKNINYIQPVLHDSTFIWFEIRTPNYLLIGTSMLRYDHKSKSFEWFDSNFNDRENAAMKFRTTPKLLKDKTGLMWIGTRPNLYKQDPKRQQFKRYQVTNTGSQTLPSDTVNNLFEDSEKKIWISTPHGLSVYQESTDSFCTYTHLSNIKNSLSSEAAYRVFEDSEQNLWICVANGINKWTRKTNSIERLLVPEPATLRGISHRGLEISEDPQGRIWASVANKGLYVLEKNGKILMHYFPDSAAVEINSIFHDTKGNTWLGEDGLGVFRFTGFDRALVNYTRIEGDTTSIEDNRPWFIVADKYENLWIGCDGSLHKYNYDQDNFTRYKDPIDAKSFTGYGFDGAGEIWFATYASGGLVSLNTVTGEFTAYGEKSGMLHNDLNLNIGRQFVTDNFGKFWLPNVRGLSVFNPETRQFNNYIEKDGFLSSKYRTQTLKASDGTIWLGGNNGLYRTDPEQLQEKNLVPPSVVITTMHIMDSTYAAADGKLFKQAVSYTSEITLAYWQKNISLEFVALHYLSSEDNLYSWNLENYDADWSSPSKTRTASYRNLSPGTYTFRVKASNADGIWNEEGATITITMTPPFWQTWWANLIYLLLFVAALRAFSKWRERNLREEKENLEVEVATRTKELKLSIDNLKSTQSQLIHSEKMASLGELTAGIAHEIQNPLNFVNNFSEVSNELISEILVEQAKPVHSRDENLVNENLANIKQILGKISHHGKRAGSIVKGMLEHSRKNEGHKESTDLNQLADECLRLSFHGLRAKDKSFTADFATDFDPSLPKVNVVSQDIGRVLLNLMNNAFYAVSEKAKFGIEGYQPIVKVSTAQFPLQSLSQEIGKEEGGYVELVISDNGPGIPDSIKDKIFQPFFTTKPTGSGTGLGLSLSYDIIKAHGGKISVHSEVGAGTEFIISLPITTNS